ncbi:MAG: hypothetical protein WAT66_12940, partial [Actinomycetota bacterium]
GSDFDTLLGVYTKDGSAFTQIACIDDVLLDPIGRSLQANVTFDTEPGVLYYVQAGGYVESFPYGKLRLAVS